MSIGAAMLCRFSNNIASLGHPLMTVGPNNAIAAIYTSDWSSAAPWLRPTCLTWGTLHSASSDVRLHQHGKIMPRAICWNPQSREPSCATYNTKEQRLRK